MSVQHLTSSKTNEWYTPPWVFGYVRKIGQIGLDPCSNPTAQQWIQAQQCFMMPCDAMSERWRTDHGLWLNPPYGNKQKCALYKNTAFIKWFLGQIQKLFQEVLLIILALLNVPNYGSSQWILKAIDEDRSGSFPWAVLLVRGDSVGVHRLEQIAISCEPFERIAFADERGSIKNSPVPGCRFWYLGTEPHKFASVFNDIGAIRVPCVYFFDGGLML
jgi:hypothetical protein